MNNDLFAAHSWVLPSAERLCCNIISSDGENLLKTGADNGIIHLCYSA